jgi:hypothetical protein
MPRCIVEHIGSSGLLISGDVLAPDRVLHRGQILIDSAGLIRCVSCDCSDRIAGNDPHRLRCGGVISPGLINTHDHIGYSHNAPLGELLERYEHRHDWRLGLRGHRALEFSGGATPADIIAHELRFVLGGATAAVSGGGQRGLLRNLDSSDTGESIWGQPVESDTFPLADAAGILRTTGCNYGEHPTHPEDIANLDAYVSHIGEGIDTEASNEITCTSSGALDLLSPQTAIVHAVALTAPQAQAIADEHAWVIWSPRSNLALYGNTAPVTLLANLGVGIALGTDWLATGSMNLLRELACADELNGRYFSDRFSDADLWRMVTMHAAFAAGRERGLGMLRPGHLADIAIFETARGLDHRAVIAATPREVVLILRGGRAIYGDAELLESEAFGASACERLDVCGIARRVCVKKETGIGLPEVEQRANAVHPLFFCGVPSAEPSCVPARPAEYSGAIAPGDADGDGITDANVACPRIFDAKRPLDGGRQADADADGIGDACDRCPLDDHDRCSNPGSFDRDEDTIHDSIDNCPDLPNLDQLDRDSDGHGDACDGCAAPNPAFSPCPLSIQAIRNPRDPEHPGIGTPVSVSGLFVTALRPDAGSARGFYAQSTSAEPYSGIFVFTGSMAPGVSIGHRVTVSGLFERYYGLDELTNPDIQIEQSSTTLPFSPLSLAPHEIATGGALAEAYESMLVQVGVVSVIVENPDAPDDYDELTVTGNLRIDDGLCPTLDNSYAIGSEFSSLTGILSFSFDNHKLLPRMESDIRYR